MNFYFRQLLFFCSLSISILGIVFWPNLTEAFLVRNLSLGSRGEDVRELQRFLNKSGLSIVVTGAGSSGNETDFFGPLTRNAVARYQELYKNEILTPINLISGTGFVGPLTRAHILKNLTEDRVAWPIITETVNFSPEVFITPEAESVDQVSSISTINEVGSDNVSTNSQTDFFPVEPKLSPTMSIFSITPTVGNLNSSVIIKGEGFLDENTVYAGNKVFYRWPSSDNGQTITVPIENTFADIDLRRGPDAKGQLIIPLWIYVENETGISNQIVFSLTLN